MFDVTFTYSWLPGQPVSKSGEAQLFALLEGVHQDGSLRAAVNRAGLSYRYAWGLIGRWEKLFGQQLIVLERGRGAHLTLLGEKLLWAQKRVHARLGPQMESLSAELARELASVLDAGTPRITVCASHDLALAALRDHLPKAKGPHLDIRFQGSSASLQALLDRECDLAGFHVSPLNLSELAGLAQALKSRHCRILHFTHRNQGLMLAAGNPLKITSLADLARGKARFVNRQAGSGTRLALDHLLHAANVAPANIRGYDQEEFTHLAVAATIASGHADAGLGIEAAAREFKLDFIPLFSEDYVFACRKDFLAEPVGTALLESLARPGVRQRMKRLPGYTWPRLGEVESAADFLAALDAAAG